MANEMQIAAPPFDRALPTVADGETSTQSARSHGVEQGSQRPGLWLNTSAALSRISTKSDDPGEVRCPSKRVAY